MFLCMSCSSHGGKLDCDANSALECNSSAGLFFSTPLKRKSLVSLAKADLLSSVDADAKMQPTLRKNV